VAAPERRYVLFTDDEDEAFAELRSRRSEASSAYPITYRGWDMATVRDMEDPPKTEKKFCVFQIQENK
jgi:hypothetical protein